MLKWEYMCGETAGAMVQKEMGSGWGRGAETVRRSRGRWGIQHVYHYYAFFYGGTGTSTNLYSVVDASGRIGRANNS